MKQDVIAIDGPAASGKSTVAKCIADELSLPYVNTGEMYRALTCKLLEEGISPEDHEAVNKLLDTIQIRYEQTDDGYAVTLNGEIVPQKRLRAPEISLATSHTAQNPQVREWMLERQRDSARLGCIVMEGRDIGTVVFPDAKWKFFVTASAHERARRRLAQDDQDFDGASLEKVAAEIAQRDERDANRPIAPLKAAEDAMYIDTTDLTINDVVEMIKKAVKN